MSSAGDVFDPLVAHAKARTLALVEDRTLGRDDGTFLLRALIDLETDGVELFGDERPADNAFYAEIERYLKARVGERPVRTLALDSALEFERMPTTLGW